MGNRIETTDEVRKQWTSDQAAILAALTYEWSQGQVNRLKLIKRQAYGRAEFDLLRHRVLARSA